MITREQAVAIVDKLLYEENGMDEWVSIPRWTEDLQHGWLIKHAEKAFRDTNDKAYLRKRYGGAIHIVDKADGKVWKIAASFNYIKDEIAAYLKAKALEDSQNSIPSDEAE